MFPLATVAGNTMILKPSEKDPGAALLLADLARQAGLPDGVLNIIHGQHQGKLRNLKFNLFKLKIYFF